MEMNIKDTHDYMLLSPKQFADVKEVTRQMAYDLINVGDVDWTIVGEKKYIVMNEKSSSYKKGVGRRKRGRPSKIKQDTQHDSEHTDRD